MWHGSSRGHGEFKLWPKGGLGGQAACIRVQSQDNVGPDTLVTCLWGRRTRDG